MLVLTRKINEALLLEEGTIRVVVLGQGVLHSRQAAANQRLRACEVAQVILQVLSHSLERGRSCGQRRH